MRAGLVRVALGASLDRLVRLNEAPAEAWVRRVRAAHPGASPAEVVALLETQLRRTVTGLGAASGAAAAAPGMTTGIGLATAPAEVAVFLEATALFARSVALVHGLASSEPARTRALVLAIALGEPGVQVVEKQAHHRDGPWGRQLLQSLPLRTVEQLNRDLGQRFATRYTRRQGLLVLGRAVPLGVGAVIGAAGNASLAKASVSAARRAFGPAPRTFHDPPGKGRVVDGEVLGRA